MDQERFEQIDRMLEAALKIEPDARPDFLKRTCDGDDDLRHEVESLLSQVKNAEKLEVPAIVYMAEEFVGQADAVFAGQRIGHYLVKEQIGVGGMGEVWKAEDERLKRAVAIKVLPPEFSTDLNRVRRFEQEALTVSALNHPNIITIYEVGQSGVLHFIVTELVKGKTLRNYLKQLRHDGERAWREAVPIVAQIVGALKAAHTAGIIHCDIKPENVMIQQDGHVKTLDFGIAKWIGTGSGGVGDEVSDVIEIWMGARPGTIRYMSPEQARGETLDARTDIFSLGLVLYEMIAGRRPYDDVADQEMIDKLTGAEEIEPISAACREIPSALDSIVFRALRKDRNERYAAAGEMLADLEELKSFIEVSRKEKGESLFRTQNANRLLTQSATLYSADRKTCISLGSLWAIRRFADLKRGLLEREVMRKSLLGGLTKACLWFLFIAAITMFAAAVISVREEFVERVMRDGHTAAVRRAVFSPDGRLLVSVGEDKKVIVWDFARRERLATFTDHQDWVTAVEFSPDGKWFATASADGSVIAWDAVRLVKAAVMPGQRGVVRAIAFSADGRLLVTPTNDDRKNIWEVGSWKKLREVNTAGYRHGQFLLSADGRWLMTQLGPLWDLVQGRDVHDNRPYFWGGMTSHGADTRPPFWSWAARAPDGRRIISIDAGGFVAFSETKRFETPGARKLTGHFRAHTNNGRAVAFSPDGKLAASGAEDIVLWDALAQKKLARFKHSANVASLAFSPKGDHLVSAHTDGSILTWDTAERELVAGFQEHHASIEAVAFANTGKRLATAGEDRSIIVWNVENGLKETVLLWHPIRITALTFSNNGQWLASNDLDGNLALWDVNARQLRWSLTEVKRIQSEASYCVAVSPDGRWLATSYGVYETGGGRLIYDFRAEDPPPDPAVPKPTEIRSLDFSSDGRWLVSVTARGDIAVRRLGDWRVIESQKLNGRHLVSVSLAPDGSRLVTGEDEGSVRLWQTQPLRETAVIGHHEARIKSVAFSPDGSQVVSAGDDKTIALWDAGGRKLITRIGLHSAPVYAVAFSPDGKQLISGGHDHLTRLYTRHRVLWGFQLD
ncbi:MAG: serine/threonine protein kinase [Acidobacteria bacterium]|nr:serine/threonine protein kinase [Acidobacteriota bacterium]